MTPEEARALLDMALHSPIMRAVIEANPPPKMTPEQADRLRRIFTAQARADARAEQARQEQARQEQAGQEQAGQEEAGQEEAGQEEAGQEEAGRPAPA